MPIIGAAVQCDEEVAISKAVCQPTLSLSVRSITCEAKDILSFELVDSEGASLPAFTAGAHIDVHVADGLIRQYSLCNDPAERGRYLIAVLNEAESRGGSLALHKTIQEGDLLEASKPQNHFRLNYQASRHMLLAGGIGVTPIISMVAELEARGAEYLMHYCTRNPEMTAFKRLLDPLAERGKVRFHHDGGKPSNGLDLASTLREYVPGDHLYCCGPAGFMSATANAVAHWPTEAVHFEYFSTPDDKQVDKTESETPFQVSIASTGDVFDVPANRTIIEVLRENGYTVETSCEEGFCGTCITKYVEGVPDHRDMVLDDDDRSDFVLICCARSKTPILVLDL